MGVSYKILSITSTSHCKKKHTGLRFYRISCSPPSVRIVRIGRGGYVASMSAVQRCSGVEISLQAARNGIWLIGTSGTRGRLRFRCLHDTAASARVFTPPRKPIYVRTCLRYNGQAGKLWKPAKMIEKTAHTPVLARTFCHAGRVQWLPSARCSQHRMRTCSVHSRAFDGTSGAASTVSLRVSLRKAKREQERPLDGGKRVQHRHGHEGVGRAA